MANTGGPSRVFNSDNTTTTPLMGGQSTPQAALPVYSRRVQSSVSSSSLRSKNQNTGTNSQARAYGKAMASAMKSTRTYGAPDK